MRFKGVLALEDTQTGDGRVIAPGAAEWAELPLPLAWIKDGDQHIDLVTAAPVVGIIDSIERVGNEIVGQGEIDETNLDGAEVIRMMREGVAPGGSRFFVSIDTDDWEKQIILTEPVDGEAEEVEILASGKGPVFAAAGDPDPGNEGGPEGELLMEDAADLVLERVTKLRIRGATLCSVSAFDGAFIELAGESEPVVEAVEEVVEAAAQSAIVRPITTAAAAPLLPPAEWFADPELSELQRFVTVTDDGRIFGHLAGWDECHIGYPGQCLDPPKSAHDYAYFRVGQVATKDGNLVATGPIALKGGHASLEVRDYRKAQAHYDDPASAIADVVLGDDEHGIWFSGALRPGVTDHDIRMLRASGVSGDWRKIGASLELIGICSVNTPGYPKLGARVASGELVALVAAGGRPVSPQRHSLESRIDALEKKVSFLNPVVLEELRSKIQAD